MNIEDYISSGILEGFVLGSITDQERREVECMSHIYPEILNELHSIQLNFESYLKLHAVQPPISVKQKLLIEIDDVVQNKPTDKSKLSLVKEDRNLNKSNTSLYFKLSLAASVLFAVITCGFWLLRENDLTLYKKQVSELSELRDTLLVSIKQLNAQLAEVESTSEKLNEVYTFLTLRETVQINLTGTEKSPESFVKVYKNEESRTALLKIDYLPTPMEGKQYQLWAIVDGIPQDMGIIILESSDSLISIPYIDNPQAFAITLEKKGGSPTPSLTEMYVLGKV